MADYTPKMLTAYKDVARAALKEEFSYKNDMMIPRLEKNRVEHGCWRSC